jgi:hypothetical protein
VGFLRLFPTQESGQVLAAQALRGFCAKLPKIHFFEVSAKILQKGKITIPLTQFVDAEFAYEN